MSLLSQMLRAEERWGGRSQEFRDEVARRKRDGEPRPKFGEIYPNYEEPEFSWKGRGGW